MDEITAYKLNTSGYVAGYIATKLLEKHDFEFCKANLVDANKTLSQSTVFIYFKQFEHALIDLCFLQEKFSGLIAIFGEVFVENLKNISQYSGISKYIIYELLKFDLSFLTCYVHKANLQKDIVKK